MTSSFERRHPGTGDYMTGSQGLTPAYLSFDHSATDDYPKV
jgi:hypothetical protein